MRRKVGRSDADAAAKGVAMDTNGGSVAERIKKAEGDFGWEEGAGRLRGSLIGKKLWLLWRWLL